MNKIILLIDDQKTHREKILKELNDSPLGNDYVVIEAESGQIGLDKYRQFKENISIMLVDYHMPDMDGLEMLRKLKKTFPNDVSKTKFFIVTTEVNQTFIDEGKALGMLSAWLIKPFSVSKVLSVLATSP